MVAFQMNISVNLSCAIILAMMLLIISVASSPSQQNPNSRQKRGGDDDDDEEEDDDDDHLNLQTRLTVYSWADHDGWLVDIDDLENRPYVDIEFASTSERTNSYKRHQGSCVEFHRNSPPTYGPNEWMWTDEKAMSKLPSHFAGSVRAVKKCGRYHRNLFCPEGTFLSKITMTRANKLRNGIILHCNFPSSEKADETIRSHGGEDENEQMPDKTGCTSFRGIRVKEDANMQATIDLFSRCSPGNPPINTQMCSNPYKQAVTGIHVDIENHTGYIKHFKVFCDEVGRIESSCVPFDRKTSVYTCDASSKQHPYTCRYQPKNIGINFKLNPTKEDTAEREFYEDFDFSLDKAGKLLARNFRDNLGKSSETGYNWKTTRSTAFGVETSITVEIVAAPGCVAEMVEIVGECSFMRSMPYYFQRLDHCPTKSFFTEEEIPQSLVEAAGSRSFVKGRGRIATGKSEERVFVSNIPEEVAEYIKDNE